MIEKSIEEPNSNLCGLMLILKRNLENFSNTKVRIKSLYLTQGREEDMLIMKDRLRKIQFQLLWILSVEEMLNSIEFLSYQLLKFGLNDLIISIFKTILSIIQIFERQINKRNIIMRRLTLLLKNKIITMDHNKT